MVPSNLESSPPLLRTPFQPFYIFAIPAYEVPKARRFRILAYQSRRKKGGENTIPTKVSLSRYDLDQITDPLARRALEHLDWNQNQINHFGFPSLRDTRSDWYFKPESLAQILKLLCDEQRLVLNYGGEHSLQQTTPLVFGEATPWELEIFITGSDTSESLSVVPRIVRQT